MPTDDEVQKARSTIFDADTGIYRERGFQRRVGFGRRPALLHIDLGNAWTRPGHAFSCDGMDTIIPAVRALNEARPGQGIPIVYTTTAYEDVEGQNSDMGLWVHKIPVELLQREDQRSRSTSGSPRPGELRDRQEACERIPRRASLELSERPRRRHGDHHRRHDGRLRPPHDRGRDRRGFRPIVVRDAVGDKCPASSRGTSSTSTRSSATWSRSSACSTSPRSSRSSTAPREPTATA